MTYEVNGKQYVVISAGGHGFIWYEDGRLYCGLCAAG
ncbi:glucose dehydrogenase [Escherichia coli]|uniref:Glucose dehydrogenase n=1 Tax=Escherichia coli TaxID=562 RepID=A0A377CVX7_ECOLX|nr:glucose dehydrogenase [Escherichia coli]